MDITMVSRLSKHTATFLIKVTFSYQEEEGTFSHRRKPKRLCIYLISRHTALTLAKSRSIIVASSSTNVLCSYIFTTGPDHYATAMMAVLAR